MESTLQIMPVQRTSRNFGEYAEEAVIIEEPIIKQKRPLFIEANTIEASLEHLRNDCIIPVFAKDNEATLSHVAFIEAVQDATNTFFSGEQIESIRCSHIVRGRIPQALGKKASELLECEKTQFYQRLAFAFTIPTIYETINGQKLELCVGGVRNYSDLNLYRSTKGLEKFSCFIGWRVRICSNQVLTGEGVKFSMEVSNIGELYRNVLDLFNNFNPAKEIHLMQTLSNTSLSQSQFAQIIGRCRCYQALPIGYQKSIPKLLITDSQINSVCRDFYHNEAFGMKDNAISLFDFHNLLTQSNKNSYVDTYLQRAVNATEISVGINNVLRGIDDKYQWFLS